MEVRTRTYVTNNLLGRLRPAPSLVVRCLSANGSRLRQEADRLPHASCGRPCSSRCVMSCVRPSLCLFHTHLAFVLPGGGADFPAKGHATSAFPSSPLPCPRSDEGFSSSCIPRRGGTEGIVPRRARAVLCRALPPLAVAADVEVLPRRPCPRATRRTVLSH